ncbi:hypothetical protein [Rhodobacter sp. TJ_12]|uniref:hypothetical protein n=1 Tax=Rhodobacter sp. TJ_12 TaxID=2029399 RepID=UPI001CBD2FBE|nr:hypothetical protein [Rhodobacter sp. TJ_12]
MNIKRSHLISVLREIERQNTGWIELRTYSPSNDADLLRRQIFQTLEEKGLVRRGVEQNFLELSPEYAKEDGRIVVSEVVFHLNAAGREFAAPWYTRAIDNVLSNIWTVVFAVFTSLALPLLGRWLEKVWGFAP